MGRTLSLEEEVYDSRNIDTRDFAEDNIRATSRP